MSSVTDEAEQILSQDVQGRVLTPRESREPIVGEYDRREMSEVKFAQYVGIKYSTLAYWLDGAVLSRSKPPVRSVPPTQLRHLCCKSLLRGP
jgi:hypothetical protein